MAVEGDKFPIIDKLVPVGQTITPGDLTPKTTPVVLTFIFSNYTQEEHVYQGYDSSHVRTDHRTVRQNLLDIS